MRALTHTIILIVNYVPFEEKQSQIIVIILFFIGEENLLYLSSWDRRTEQKVQLVYQLNNVFHSNGNAHFQKCIIYDGGIAQF